MSIRRATIEIEIIGDSVVNLKTEDPELEAELKRVLWQRPVRQFLSFDEWLDTARIAASPDAVALARIAWQVASRGDPQVPDINGGRK